MCVCLCVPLQESASHQMSMVLLPAVGLVVLRAIKVLTTVKVRKEGVSSWEGGGVRRSDFFLSASGETQQCQSVLPVNAASRLLNGWSFQPCWLFRSRIMLSENGTGYTCPISTLIPSPLLSCSAEQSFHNVPTGLPCCHVLSACAQLSCRG